MVAKKNLKSGKARRAVHAARHAAQQNSIEKTVTTRKTLMEAAKQWLPKANGRNKKEKE